MRRGPGTGEHQATAPGPSCRGSLPGAAVRDELIARSARPSTSLDLVVTCVVGAFMGLLAAWVDGEIATTPAEPETAFRATVEPGARELLPQPGAGSVRRVSSRGRCWL